MKKYAVVLLVLALLLPACAMAYYHPTTFEDTAYPTPVYGTLNARMATRTGPGTQYSEPGTFFSSGDTVKIISITYDKNGVGWVQVEFSGNGGLMRAYTGIKRFDNVRKNSVYMENPVGEGVRLSSSCSPLYGPGTKYARHKQNLGAGAVVYPVEYENGYFMCDYKRSGVWYRGWFPESCL